MHKFFSWGCKPKVSLLPKFRLSLLQVSKQVKSEAEEMFSWKATFVGDVPYVHPYDMLSPHTWMMIRKLEITYHFFQLDWGDIVLPDHELDDSKSARDSLLAASELKRSPKCGCYRKHYASWNERVDFICRMPYLMS
jgi:hypothetical protein